MPGPKDEVASPCIEVCIVSPTRQLCIGCFRTIDEIAAWSRMSNDQKREVLRKIEERRRAESSRRP